MLTRSASLAGKHGTLKTTIPLRRYRKIAAGAPGRVAVVKELLAPIR